jgi:hypothetical protein
LEKTEIRIVNRKSPGLLLIALKFGEELKKDQGREKQRWAEEDKIKNKMKKSYLCLFIRGLCIGII